MHPASFNSIKESKSIGPIEHFKHIYKAVPQPIMTGSIEKASLSYVISWLHSNHESHSRTKDVATHITDNDACRATEIAKKKKRKRKKEVLLCERNTVLQWFTPYSFRATLLTAPLFSGTPCSHSHTCTHSNLEAAVQSAGRWAAPVASVWEVQGLSQGLLRDGKMFVSLISPIRDLNRPAYPKS